MLCNSPNRIKFITPSFSFGRILKLITVAAEMVMKVSVEVLLRPTAEAWTKEL